ncbi:uncharacterized protein B0H18DRAFT_15978 [Fomitopsis serialis]|uniref:uncharacterized protein n=1 Tax=Fomitopsis serialis TaxID=139415 RepID=UPI00200797ED|nr:uncharacterized protein B0H18DRAFT_15978 [Neoantrodia serialis]KAH9938458.1 hypothetical protein B0H18DRAFT_15978 [Neoantrodia serialis]
MYNGIGLTTPRGSGTNGYVVRNLSTLRVHQTAADRASAWDIAPPKHREPDAAILEHEKKRKVEVKCLELQLELEEKGLDEDELKN